MNTTFDISTPDAPPIYKIRLDKPSELQTLYSDILKDVPVSEVHNELAKYVTSVIEPIEWHAIWRTTQRSSGLDFQADFKVEVVDVTHSSLEAVVILRHIIAPPHAEMTASQAERLNALLAQRVTNVPLIELYVISENDPENQYIQTALVIEHIRFFFKYIWRPWDELLGTNIPLTGDMFIEGRLQPRLNLCFDVQNKIIAESTVNQIKQLLKEAWQVRYQFDDRSKILANKPQNEDPNREDYLDESEVYEALRLQMRLEDIAREMRMLEDPHLRVIASNMNRNYEKELDQKQNGEEGSPAQCHVLCNRCTSRELKAIVSKLEDSADIEMQVQFHNNLSKALRFCKSGDKLLILPGLYVCDSLPWIESDIQIKGLGEKREEVVLESSDSVGDIFLNCNSQAVLISNLTLRCSAETHCILMVHSGHVTLENCLLDGAKCARNSIIALSKAEVAMDNCQIIHEAPDDGVIKRPGSNISINGIETGLGMNASQGRLQAADELSVVTFSSTGATGDVVSNQEMKTSQESGDEMNE